MSPFPDEIQNLQSNPLFREDNAPQPDFDFPGQQPLFTSPASPGPTVTYEPEPGGGNGPLMPPGFGVSAQQSLDLGLSQGGAFAPAAPDDGIQLEQADQPPPDVPAEPEPPPDELELSPLTTERRKKLPKSSFVFPEDKRYPIHDRAHGANALARASGKPEYSKVKKAVCSRYPDLPACKVNASQEPEPDEHGASVFQPELKLAGSEQDGLIYKVVCKTGTLALSPGPGQMDVEQPLELTPEMFAEVKDAWDDGAVRYVTLPETHQNGTFENKGYVKDLQILDQPGVQALFGEDAASVVAGDEPNTQYMAAGLQITNEQAKQAVLEGSVADMSVGIKFNGRPNKQTGKLYPAYLEHVTFTNQPWVDGLVPFNPAILSQPFDQERVEDWDGVFMSLQDGGDPPREPLPRRRRRSKVQRTMPERKRQTQSKPDPGSKPEVSLEQILADQTARAEAAEQAAKQANTRLAQAEGQIASQGRQLHLGQVKERIRVLQLEGVPPAVLFAARDLMEADFDPAGDKDELTLSQQRPSESGEPETVEVKLSTPTEIVEYLLASVPRQDQPDLRVMPGLQELHADRREQKTDEQKAQEAADELERRLHPERYDSDGKRKAQGA